MSAKLKSWLLKHHKITQTLHLRHKYVKLKPWFSVLCTVFSSPLHTFAAKIPAPHPACIATFMQLLSNIDAALRRALNTNLLHVMKLPSPQSNQLTAIHQPPANSSLYWQQHSVVEDIMFAYSYHCCRVLYNPTYVHTPGCCPKRDTWQPNSVQVSPSIIGKISWWAISNLQLHLGVQSTQPA